MSHRQSFFFGRLQVFPIGSRINQPQATSRGLLLSSGPTLSSFVYFKIATFPRISNLNIFYIYCKNRNAVFLSICQLFLIKYGDLHMWLILSFASTGINAFCLFFHQRFCHRNAESLSTIDQLISIFQRQL